MNRHTQVDVVFLGVSHRWGLETVYRLCQSRYAVASICFRIAEEASCPRFDTHIIWRTKANTALGVTAIFDPTSRQ